MDDNLAPRMRASQAARQDAAEFLAAAYADGQLNTTEFDERTAQAWSAVFADELTGLTADLSPIGDLGHNAPAVTGRRPAPHSTALSYVTNQPGGISSSIAVMGEVERTGDWVVSANHLSIALMGGTDLNLLQARFSSPNTRISANAVMGGVTIIVPEDVRVKSEGFALMGGFGVSDHKSVTINQRDLPDDAPTLVIAGFALMGGVDVIRAARDARL